MGWAAVGGNADDEMTLPVPEAVRAVYLVPTEALPDPVDLVRRSNTDRWAGPPAGDDAVPSIVVRPVGAMPTITPSLLAAMGATDEQVARVETATHLVVVSVDGPPGWPPTHEWVARAVAATAAEEMDSDVVDLLNYQLLTVDRARATLPDADGRIRLADWIWVAYSTDSHGYWVTTTGLRRFGLPELQTFTTPPNVVDEWGRAMTGIARRLLDAWCEALADDRDAAFVQLPVRLEVSGHDVTRAYGRGRPVDAGGPAAAIRLGHDPRSDPEHHSFLTIQPPLDWSGSAGEYIASVCATLFGPRTHEVRHARPSEIMDRAIATARAGLTGIRGRFESGALELRTKLLVKYALPGDTGTEYVWAYVTSWRDPYRILAMSASDAVYHPKVRTGRPVVVDTASVVDWAVEHDDDGIIEGAWTQAALDD